MSHTNGFSEIFFKNLLHTLHSNALLALSFYWKNGKVKVALAVGKGKQSYDKRHEIKRRESDLELKRATMIFRKAPIKKSGPFFFARSMILLCAILQAARRALMSSTSVLGSRTAPASIVIKSSLRA